MARVGLRRLARRIRSVLCIVALPLAGAALAQGPGAKDLFFGDQPALASARGFQRTGGTAAEMAAPEPSPAPAPAAAPPAAKPAPSQAARPAPPQAAKPSHPGLRVWLTDAADASGAKRLSPQQTFRTGDRVRLSVQPNRDGHLYVINVGSSGKTAVLFPTRGADNRVQRFKDLSFTAPLVFGDPPGVEQLVVVLADGPLDEVPVQLRSGSMQRVTLRGGGSLAPAAGTPAPPTQRAAAPQPQTQPVAQAGGQGTAQGGSRDAAGDSLDLALADLRGAKDLKFDDDGAELVAVSNRSDERPGRFAPVVVNLRLVHKR